jgi:hypothetical protein
MVIENREPMTAIKIIVISLNPNHKIASGNQLILGNVCIPITNLPNVSSMILDLFIKIPKTAPNKMEIPNPMETRNKLINIALIKMWVLKPWISAFHTIKGAGKIYAGHIFKANKKYHKNNKTK